MHHLSTGEQEQRQALEQRRTCFGEPEQLRASAQIFPPGYESTTRYESRDAKLSKAADYLSIFHITSSIRVHRLFLTQVNLNEISSRTTSSVHAVVFGSLSLL